jgi:hypothetical protein
MAEQVVGSGRLLLGVRARRQDIEIGVALHRVGVDDLAVETLRERDGQLRLAAGRRAVDQESQDAFRSQLPQLWRFTVYAWPQRLLERVARPNATRL